MTTRRVLVGLVTAAAVAVSFAQVDADFEEAAGDPSSQAESASTQVAQLDDTDAKLQQADAAYREGNETEALRLYQEVLARRPSSAHVRARITELRSSVSKAGTPTATSGAPAITTGVAPAAGNVQPTATGAGGSTPQTASLPLQAASLAAMRQKYLAKPEYRAGWITRFNWTSRNPDEIRSKIIQELDRAKALNLNTIFFQVRHEAATLYPSQLEPWSRLLGGKDPGFDPVEFAISETHKRGMQFHAYYNACTASDERNKPTDPNHIWFKHCTEESNPNWLVYEGGKIAPFEEYWWFNVNLPEVQTYIRMGIVDFVSRYDIDGLHFDRIRFPNSRVSDDPWSKARYAGDANPGKLNYAEWQRDNLTRMVTDIYGAVNAIKPKVAISAAVWGIYDKTKLPQGGKSQGYSWTSSGLQDYNQDSIAWINKGCMDMLVPMIYWDMGGDKPDWDELVADFLKQTTNGRFIIAGQKCFDGPEMLRQAVAANVLNAHGTCPFTVARVYELALQAYYRTNINPNEVAPPPMPWKEQPTNGLILVAVKNAQGVPVMDAQVRMAGRQDVWLSSADGFCAIIDAAPGTVTLNAQKSGIAPAASAPVTVAAGQAGRAEILLR